MTERPKELERMGRCALLAWEHAVEKYEASTVPRSGVTTGHILLGVLKEDACAGGLILRALELDLPRAYAITEFVMLHSRKVGGDTDPPLDWGGKPHTIPAKRVMEISVDEANLFTPSYPIGTEHLLLALLRVPDSIGRRALHFLGMNEDAVRGKRDELWKLLRSPE